MMKKYVQSAQALLMVFVLLLLTACNDEKNPFDGKTSSVPPYEYNYYGGELMGGGPNETFEGNLDLNKDKVKRPGQNTVESGNPGGGEDDINTPAAVVTGSPIPSADRIAAHDKNETHEEGADAAFRKYATLSVGGDSNVVFKGDPGKITVRLKNSGRTKTAKGVVKFRLTSIYEEVYSKDIAFDETKTTANFVDVILNFNTDQLIGYWALKVDILTDGEKFGEVTRPFAVINKPRTYNEFDPDNFFGVMGIEDNVIANRLGVKVDRLSVYWRFTQDVNGGVVSYNWSGLDAVFAEHEKNFISTSLLIQPEIHIFGNQILKGADYTVTSAYDIISKPEVMRDYKLFVRALVERYKDRVINFEICNEADLDLTTELKWADLTYQQAGEVTARLMEEGYAIIKELCPGMPVSGMSVSERRYFAAPAGKRSTTDWMFYYNRPGYKMVDVFSIHPYPQPWDVSPIRNKYSTPEQNGFYDMVKNGAEYAKKNGVMETHVTEVGYAVGHFEALLSFSRKMQAALIPRTLIISKSVPDVTRGMVFNLQGWDPTYAGGDLGTGDMALVSGSSEQGKSYPNPAAATFATCMYMLHNTKSTRAINLGKGDISVYQFQNDASSIVAAWYDGRTRSLDFNGIPSLEVYDMYGKLVGKGNCTIELSDALHYFTANLADAEKLAKCFE